MRKIFFVLACLFSSTLFAQQLKFQQYIGWRGGTVELHTISNKQQSCTLVMGKDSVRAFLFGDNGDIEEFAIPVLRTEVFRDGFIKEGKVYLFLHDEKKHGLHSWLYNIADKSVKSNTIDFTLKDDKLIERFSTDNYYCYFNVNKKTKEFVIDRFTDEIHFERFTYPVTQAVLNNIKDDNLFSSEAFNVKKVAMEGECDLDVAQSRDKIYIKNDTLYLLMNNGFDTTKQYTFDLINKNISTRMIFHKLKVKTTEEFTGNSFLAGDKLYYIAATHDSIWMQVLDFYSGTILKQYKAGREDTINFRNTPVMQESSTVFNIPTERELTKTRQLLRKMLNGAAVIIATPDDSTAGHTIITVGSYKKVQSPGVGGGLWMPGGVGSGPVFIPTGGFSSGTWVRSAHFKTLLDDSTSEQLPGNIHQSINDRIEKYSAGVDIPSEAKNLFKHDGNYYYAYYDRDTRKLMVVQF